MSGTDIESMSDEQLIDYATKKMPKYRLITARLRSFMKSLFGFRRNTATAAGDYKIDVTEGDGIKTGGGLRLSSFKAPSFTKLKAHIGALQDSDDIDELDRIVTKLSRSDNPNNSRAAKAIFAQHAAMTEEYNNALEAVENFANKHIPSEVAEEFQKAQDAVNAFLSVYADTKVALDPMVLVGSEDDRIDFVQYHEATEYTESKLWIVVTCSLAVVGREYVLTTHVNILDRFQAPFNYDVGDAVKDIKNDVRFLFASEGVVAVTGALAFKVDATRITKALKALDFVKDVQISKTAINVWVKFNKKTPAQETEIFAVIASDVEVRRKLGRSNRLHSTWTEDKHWQFVITQRG